MQANEKTRRGLTDLTPIVATIGFILVVSLKPIRGLLVYGVLLIWYPTSLMVDLGTLSFSVGRVVIIGLLIRCVLEPDLMRRFKWNGLDKAILIYYVGQLIAGIFTMPVGILIENRGGDFMDLFLPYLAVRLIVKDREDLLRIVKGMVIAAALLAPFALWESVTGRNLLSFGRVRTVFQDKRLGFTRARGTFDHPIYLGVFLGMVGTLSLAAWRYVRAVGFYVFLTACAFVGSFASVSSGAVMTMFFGLGFVLCYRYRQYWKAGLITIAMMCLVVEIVSNRHFYQVIDRVSFNSATAWYRARLIEKAFFEGGMKGHWLFGYGFTEPGWGRTIDSRDHTDMVNHYLLILCRFGLAGLIPFVYAIVVTFKNLLRGFWKRPEREQWLVWCVCASLVGVLMAFHSVSGFTPVTTYLFMIIAFSCVLKEEPLQTITMTQKRGRAHERSGR